MRALRRTHSRDKHLLAAPPMSTMTEGAVDALEELDFEPVCDYCRPVLCDTAATWALRFDPPPCEHHAHVWLSCDGHMRIRVRLLAEGVVCSECWKHLPRAGHWRSLR